MSMTKPPAEWHFYLTLPDPSETRPLSREWEVEVKDTIAYAGLEYAFRLPLKVSIEGYWTKPHFFVSMNLDATVEVPCARCLEKSEVAIKGQFSYLYGLVSDQEEASDESEDEMFVALHSWKSVIDIKDQVWEGLVLSLPENVLCSKDCKGLCPICGKNLNEGDCGCNRESTDPRLDVLKKLSEDMKE